MHSAQCALHTQPFPSSQLPQALWRHHRSQPSFAPSSPDDIINHDGQLVTEEGAPMSENALTAKLEVIGPMLDPLGT